MAGQSEIELRLQDALAECERLRKENDHLRGRLAGSTAVQPPPKQAGPTTTGQSSAAEKVKLFRSLFRGREDVFAVRWTSRNGKSGYSPACSRQSGSKEPKEYFPLTNEVVRNHLTGKITVGVYPLLEDDYCCFLAVDFDKREWSEDAREFLQETCLREWANHLGLLLSPKELLPKPVGRAQNT